MKPQDVERMLAEATPGKGSIGAYTDGEGAHDIYFARGPLIYDKCYLDGTAMAVRDVRLHDVSRSLLPLLVELWKAAAVAELSMDTAASHGVEDILPPAYKDSWAEHHGALQKAIITLSEFKP